MQLSKRGSGISEFTLRSQANYSGASCKGWADSIAGSWASCGLRSIVLWSIWSQAVQILRRDKTCFALIRHEVWASKWLIVKTPSILLNNPDHTPLYTHIRSYITEWRLQLRWFSVSGALWLGGVFELSLEQLGLIGLGKVSKVKKRRQNLWAPDLHGFSKE